MDETHPHPEVGRKLRLARLQRGWSLQATAVELGCSIGTVFHRERGRDMTLSALREHAAAVGAELRVELEVEE